VNSSLVVLSIGGVAVVALLALIASTLRTRRSAELDSHRSGTIWRRGYHLAAELLAGRATVANTADLIEFIDQTPEPMTVAASLAVAVRQEPHEMHAALRSAVERSRLPKVLRARLNSDDPHRIVEALEIVEVLRLQTLLGDAAALTLHRDQRIVRAACDAVVEIDPSTGLGVLIGLVDSCESWVLDSIGRATTTLNARGGYNGPLSQAQWGNAPMLARRVLDESAIHDRATVGDAVSTLIRSLDDPSAAKRLAAVTALSTSIDHPAAQLALAGALGSSDRMTRYAVAASLSDSVVGRQILRRAAAEADGSDAARMAAEILWSGDSHEREVQFRPVAS
jgi:hypothetical protein